MAGKVQLALAAVAFACLALFSGVDCKHHHRRHRHHHQQRHKRAFSATKLNFDAIAKKVHLDTSSMSTQCKANFSKENAKCLTALVTCIQNVEKCGTIQAACALGCTKDRCDITFELIALNFKAPVLPLCMPQSCRGKSYRAVLTAITKSVYMTSSSIGKKNTGGLVNPILSAQTKCGYTQVFCKSTAKCHFQQLRDGEKPTPYVPPKGHKGPIFHIATARTPKATFPRSHPVYPLIVTGSSDTKSGSDEGGSSEEGPRAHSGSSNDNHAASGHMVTCGGQRCSPGLTCCKVRGKAVGCCPVYVQDLLYSGLTAPLEEMSTGCALALVQQKGQCIRNYVAAMSQITANAASAPLLWNSLASNVTDFSKLHTCFTESGGKPCASSDRCTLAGTMASSFGKLVGLPTSQNYVDNNVCLPRQCSSRRDLQEIATILHAGVCGPFCTLIATAQKTPVGNLYPSTCPLDRLTLTCQSASHSEISVSRAESDGEDICAEVIEEIKTGKLTSQHVNNPDAQKSKKALWHNTWFIIAVVGGAVCLLIGIPLVVRWHLYNKRRRAMHEFSYANLNDERAVPDAHARE